MRPRPSECKSGYASSRRRNLTLPNRRQSTTFFEYRCPGPPDNDIGTLGDIYVNTDSRTCEIYAKVEGGWRVWPGLQIRATERLAHPKFLELFLTISAKNRTVGWFDETHAPPRMYAGCSTSHECTLRFLQEKEERVPAKRRRSNEHEDLAAKRATSSFVHTFHSKQVLPSYLPYHPTAPSYEYAYYAPMHQSHSFDGAAPCRQPLMQLYPPPNPSSVSVELGPFECERHATFGLPSTSSFDSAFRYGGRDDEDKSHAITNAASLDAHPSPLSSNRRFKIAQPQAVVIRDLMATHQLLNTFGASTTPSSACNGSPRPDDLPSDTPELSSSTSMSSAASEDLPLSLAPRATQFSKTFPLDKTISLDASVCPKDPTRSSPRAYIHRSTRSTTGTTPSGIEACVSFVDPSDPATQTRASEPLADDGPAMSMAGEHKAPRMGEPTTLRTVDTAPNTGDLRAVLEDALLWIDCSPEFTSQSAVATCRLQDTVLPSGSIQDASGSISSPATDYASPYSIADSPLLAYKTPQQILDAYAFSQASSSPLLSVLLEPTSGTPEVSAPSPSNPTAIECFDLRDPRLSPTHSIRARSEQNLTAPCQPPPLASGLRLPSGGSAIVLSLPSLRSDISSPTTAPHPTAPPPAYWNYDYRRPLHPAYYFPRASVGLQGKADARFFPGTPAARRDRSVQPPYRRRTKPTVQAFPSSSSCFSSSTNANDAYVAGTLLAHELPAAAPHVAGPPSTSSAVRTYTGLRTGQSPSYAVPAYVGGPCG